MLETKRLILRQYCIDDFDALYEILSDKDTMRFYPEPFGEEKIRRWINWNIENYKIFGFGLWALQLKENRKFIGDCGITMQNINNVIKPEIGYHIHKAYQSMGYATEAAAACRDYIFTNTPFESIFSYMNKDNIASRRVAEKNGMTLCESFTDRLGEADVVYKITRCEWQSLTKTEY